MASAHYPPTAPIHEWKWSPREKAVARKAFDRALRRELELVIQEARERAAGIGEASQLWELERWLSERRREIDRQFDFRYSVLPVVFAALLHNGQLSEDDLHGLTPEKLASIRHMARY